MAKRSEVLEAGALERAVQAAASAAASAGAEVAELRSRDDLRAAADLFVSVWGARPDGAPISRDLMRALAHTGNYVTGARRGSELVGASVGFIANGGPEYKLHSHITGLTPDAQVKGIGFALKLHQRAWAIARSLPVISWTFDPLTRRNAYFNLTKLGAEASGFLVNFYGQMDDRLNGGDETDRCEVTWDLTSERSEAASVRSLREPELEPLLAAGAVKVLEDRGDGRPRTRAVRGEVRLCWIPADIVALRSTEPDVARSWRLALRDTLGASIDEGFVASAMTRSGWYVLEHVR